MCIFSSPRCLLLISQRTNHECFSMCFNVRTRIWSRTNTNIQFLNTTQHCCSQCLRFTNNTQHVQVRHFKQYITLSRVLPKETSLSPSEERIWCVWELGSSNMTSFWSLESVHKEIRETKAFNWAPGWLCQLSIIHYISPREKSISFYFTLMRDIKLKTYNLFW